MIDDKATRERAATILAGVADALAQKLTRRSAQEAPITTRIAQSIEDVLTRNPLEDFDISVSTLDIPDRGSQSLENKCGADLYVNVSVTTKTGVERKGLLIQAKRGKGSKKELPAQCKKMLKHCSHAYGWIYNENGVQVVDAQKVVDNPGKQMRRLGLRSSKDMFESVLACREGDRNLALPLNMDPEAGLERIQDRLGVEVAADVAFIQTPGRRTTSTRITEID
jgi:hypothetical protein